MEQGLAWSAIAIGDGGLLHVRERELLQAFPIATADELSGDPLTIPSVNRRNDHALEFRSAEGIARNGDWLVLTTDALLGWALANTNAASRPTGPRSPNGPTSSLPTASSNSRRPRDPRG